jgi:hypothetical protein
VGLLLLSLLPSSETLLFLALLLVGLSLGTESDILGFLVRRFFGLRVYSTVFSMLGAGITIASASGGLLESLFLRATGHYWPFFMTASGLVLIGSSLVLFLPRRGAEPELGEVSAA